jgi:hypothetical protein
MEQIEKLHQQFPKIFKTKENKNFRSLIEAIGTEDQFSQDLLSQVRKQFFIQTANYPYLDQLGNNVKVSRPNKINFSDDIYRKYIALLANSPKQIKNTVNQLLELLFSKELTIANTVSLGYEPFSFKDGWDLTFKIDGIYDEIITFEDTDFRDISNITAQELTDVLNKQLQFCTASVYKDAAYNNNYIKIYTNTIGAEGSVELVGGRANLSIKFEGYYSTNTSSTWNFTKKGSLVTATWSGGTTPNLHTIKEGDVVIFDSDTLPFVNGSFKVITIDLSNTSFTFENASMVEGTYSDFVMSFFSPLKKVLFKNNLKACCWELTQNAVTIEYPSSGVLNLKSKQGACHIDRNSQGIVNIPDQTNIEILDASTWPDNGSFIINGFEDVISYDGTNTFVNSVKKRYSSSYKYQGKTGNTLTNITPSLPHLAGLYLNSISSISRNTFYTTVTIPSHSYKVNDQIVIRGVTPTNFNGTFIITETTPTSVKYFNYGIDEVGSGGEIYIEKPGLAIDKGLLLLQTYTPGKGNYVWDIRADYVLSDIKTTLSKEILASTNLKILEIEPNDQILNEEGWLMLEYGTSKQEGPIKIISKPYPNIIFIDPAYSFIYNHDVGSGVTLLSKIGAIEIKGNELAPYITDTSVIRTLTQELIAEIKSTGCYVDYLIKYPIKYYLGFSVD